MVLLDGSDAVKYENAKTRRYDAIKNIEPAESKKFHRRIYTPY